MQTTDPPTKTPNHSFILAHQSGPEREKKCKKNSKKENNQAAQKKRKRISKSIFWQTNKPIDVGP